MKHGVVPAWRSCPGVISFSTTMPSIGDRISPSPPRTWRPCRISSSVFSSTPERMQLHQGRVAVGLGRDGVGFGLLHLAAREGVVLEELRVEIGDAPEVSRGDLGLAIGADRDAEVGRGDARERLALLDRDSHVDEQPRDGARDGGEHLGGLVGVEGHGAGGFERAAEVRRLDLLHADLRALRRGKGQVAGPGLRGAPSCRPSRRRPRARAATPRTRRRPGGIFG